MEIFIIDHINFKSMKITKPLKKLRKPVYGCNTLDQQRMEDSLYCILNLDPRLELVVEYFQFNNGRFVPDIHKGKIVDNTSFSISLGDSSSSLTIPFLGLRSGICKIRIPNGSVLFENPYVGIETKLNEPADIFDRYLEQFGFTIANRFLETHPDFLSIYSI